MKKPLVYAHRGASGYAPENTLPAFEKALEMGADGIEIDVHFSKDGALIVTHDEYIDRVSDGHGFVCQQTLEELRQYNFNCGMEEFGPVQVPELQQVFSLIKQHGALLNIEIKNSVFPYPGLEEAILRLADEMGVTGQLVFSSFNHASMAHVKRLRPSVPAALLYGAVLDHTADYAKSCGVDGIHPIYVSAWEDIVQEVHEAGLFCNVWTVNDPDHMKLILARGVDAIITNYPDVAVRIRDAFVTQS